MATVTAATPSPATICAMSPPKEWPMTGLPLELADGVNVVIGDLLEPLVGKDLRVVIRLLDGLRVIGPARGERGVALLFEQCTPAVPTGCEEPEAVHEHDRLLPFRVGAVDLLLFMGREKCHSVLLVVIFLIAPSGSVPHLVDTLRATPGTHL